MKIKVTLLALATMAIAVAHAAGSGIKDSLVKKELTKVEDFSAIKIYGSPDVEYTQTQGQKPRVTIYALPEFMDMLEVSTTNGELRVTVKQSKKRLQLPNKIIWKVVASGSTPLNMVSTLGSGDITLKGTCQGENLTLQVSGSGDIEAKDLHYTHLHAQVRGSGDITVSKAQCTDLQARILGSGDITVRNLQSAEAIAWIAGSGDITLQGKTEKADLSVAGSGDIDAENLQSPTVKAQVNGSGDIECWSTQRLQASVNGSGEILYHGNPTVSKSGRTKSIIKE